MGRALGVRVCKYLGKRALWFTIEIYAKARVLAKVVEKWLKCGELWCGGNGDDERPMFVKVCQLCYMEKKPLCSVAWEIPNYKNIEIVLFYFTTW